MSFRTTTLLVADNSAALTLGYEHELQLGIYQLAHLLNQFPNLPLRPGAESLIRHVHQFPEIKGHIQRGGTGVGEDVPSVLIGNTFFLVVFVPVLNILHIICEATAVDSRRFHIIKPILRAIPLAALGEAAMSMSHKLMGTGSGDTFDFEGEVDMFKN